ncbi:hypothetical protein AB0K68_38990 [Streptomyces sp. NPDC050698]
MTDDQQMAGILGELAAAMADAPPSTEGYWTSEELHGLYERLPVVFSEEGRRVRPGDGRR